MFRRRCESASLYLHYKSNILIWFHHAVDICIINWLFIFVLNKILSYDCCPAGQQLPCLKYVMVFLTIIHTSFIAYNYIYTEFFTPSPPHRFKSGVDSEYLYYARAKCRQQAPKSIMFQEHGDIRSTPINISSNLITCFAC